MFYKKIKNLIVILLLTTLISCSTVCAKEKTPQSSKIYLQPHQLSQSTSSSNTKPLTPEHIDLEKRPWSIMLYTGSTTKTQLGQLLRFNYDSAHETIYTTELAYNLHQNNILRRILYPFVSTIQLAGNIAYRIEHRDTPNNIEGDLYLILRWTNFPWNKYLTTTLAAGEGISYTSRIPYEEIDGTTSEDSRRLLNYLMFEATFAHPSHPEWQLVGRIHHRSTAYGIFGHTNGGSNNVGLGIRYYFDF